VEHTPRRPRQIHDFDPLDPDFVMAYRVAVAMLMPADTEEALDAKLRYMSNLDLFQLSYLAHRDPDKLRMMIAVWVRMMTGEWFKVVNASPGLYRSTVYPDDICLALIPQEMIMHQHVLFTRRPNAEFYLLVPRLGGLRLDGHSVPAS
jgi:hypothetical protein